MHVNQVHGLPFTATARRPLCWLMGLLLITLPAASPAATLPAGRLCNNLLHQATLPLAEPLSLEKAEAALRKKFSDRLPEPQGEINSLLDLDVIETGSPRRIPRKAVARFRLAMQNPKAQISRVGGFAGLRKLFEELEIPATDGPLPDRRTQALGVVPPAMTVGGIAVSIVGHAFGLHAPYEVASALVGMAGFVSTTTLALYYGDARAAYWWDRLRDLLERFSVGEDLEEVSLTNFRLRIPQEDLIEYPAHAPERRVRLELKTWPGQLGRLQFAGERMARLGRGKPSLDLEFWLLLYYDDEQRLPVLIFGTPT